MEKAKQKKSTRKIRNIPFSDEEWKELGILADEEYTTRPGLILKWFDEARERRRTKKNSGAIDV